MVLAGLNSESEIFEVIQTGADRTDTILSSIYPGDNAFELVCSTVTTALTAGVVEYTLCPASLAELASLSTGISAPLLLWQRPDDLSVWFCDHLQCATAAAAGGACLSYRRSAPHLLRLRCQ